MKTRFLRRRRFAILVIVAVFIGAAYTLGWSSVFSIKQVVVIGAPTKSESDAIQASVRLGAKLARIEPRALNATLQNFDWLRNSQIRRNWINGTVTIEVFARTPIAKIDGVLIDSAGHKFTLPGKAESKLPIIRASSVASRTFAVKLLNLIPTEIKDSLTLMDATGPHYARLQVRTNSSGNPSENNIGNTRELTIIWGDLTNSELKGRVYKALLALPENSKVKVIDVSAPHAPIVK